MKFKDTNLFILLLLFLFLLSCKDDVISNQNTQTQSNQSVNLQDFRQIDQYAKFISGFSTEDYKDFQEKDFYKNYSNSAETNWNYFSIHQQFVIMNWAEKNQISTTDDTATVFYPFAGPDFTFVYSFFPFAKDYLLIGLENIGEIPDFKQYSDIEIVNFLNSMSDGLVEFFTQGYFSTQTMKNNFRKNNVNGVIHPLLFFIYRTNHTIVDFQYFVINDLGKKEVVQKLETLDKRIKGVMISFDGKNGKKNLYYLQVDLSNENFKEHPELTTFISNFGEKNVFLKSASYLLQEDKLNDFRELLITQAYKIIQDDSGFDYKFLKSKNCDVSVFGKYTRTLNLFKDYWQPDLEDEFKNQNTKKLPFRFGYNVPFDETAIIFAKKQENTEIQYPIYKVQFRMSWNKLPLDSLPNNFSDVDYYFDEGYYKYTVGNFKTEDECRKTLEFVRKNGFSDAFMVEFNKEARRTIE